MMKGISLIFVCALVSGIQAQKSWPEERGLAMTVYSYTSFFEYEVLKHFEKFPGYENVSDVKAVGIELDDYYIQLYSIALDYRGKAIFVYDDYYRAIFYFTGYSKALDPLSLNFGILNIGVSSGSIQLAYDWLSHTLYWCDSAFRWIVAASTQADKIDMDFRKILVNDHLDSPAGIAVDPVEGLLFWVDAGNNPKIESSTLLGQDRHTIVEDHLEKPSHMEADIHDKRLYWIQGNRAVHTAKYDGSDRRALFSPSGKLYDLAIFRDLVYVTDINNDKLYTYDKNTGEKAADDVEIEDYTIHNIAVYSEENQPMDKDFCEELNCDQLCISIKNGSKCECSDGYQYDDVSSSCKEKDTGLHKAVAFASSTKICWIDIRTIASFGYDPVCTFSVPEQSNPDHGVVRRRRDTAASGDLIKMIELNMKELTAYYASVDNKIYARPLVLPPENDAIDLLVEAGNISGLAFDPVDNFLYWSEIGTGDKTDNIRRVNVKDKVVDDVKPSDVTINNPRNILFLHLQRRVAWVAGETGNMSIQTMGNDGSGILDVVEGYHTIGSLTVDQEKQIFYFLVPDDVNVLIHSVPVDGSQVPTTMSANVRDNAYLLIHYNNYLAWFYTREGYPNLMQTYDYVEKSYIGNGMFDSETTIISAAVLDVKQQTPERFNPCAIANGGCSQICLSKYINGAMAKTCKCRLGYKLQSDNMACKSDVVTDNFLLFTDWTHDLIHQYDLQKDEINAIPIADINSIYALIYNAESKKLIWSEYLDSNVYIANLNGTDRKILADLDPGNAYRFALDTSTGNYYYTGYSSDHIGLITPSGKNVVLNDDFFWENLRAIAVFPEKGYLYFSAFDYSSSYIARSYLNGTNVTKILEGDLVYSPDGLTIDYKNEYLYWCDATYDIIQRCNLDAQDCTTIVNATGDEEQITDIVTDGEFLYYSTHKTTRVVRVNLAYPYERVEVGYHFTFGNLDTLALYRSTNLNVQSGKTACSSRGGLGDCSTVCIPTPNNSRECRCEAGVEMRLDGTTCANIHQCTDVISLSDEATPLTDEEVLIRFKRSCFRRVNDACDYQCPRNYRPIDKSNVTLTCTENGWDRESFDQLCEENRCPVSIENGMLGANCSRDVGDLCEFTCNDTFSKTEDKTYCNKDGSWHGNNSILCTPYQCPDAIIQDNLRISLVSPCTRQINATCGYTCPTDYTRIGNTNMACTSTGWDRRFNQLCTVILCPQTLNNGKLDDKCLRKVGIGCPFSCNDGYTKTEETTVCLKTGAWHKKADAFCTSGSVTTVAALDDYYKKTDVTIGIVAFVVLFLILLLVIAALICRQVRSMGKKSHYKEGRASFHKNADNVADGKEDRTYVSTSRPGSIATRDSFRENTSYIQPRIADDSSSVGYNNPLYRAEPLRAVSQVDPAKDMKVSYSDWMMSRQRESFRH